MPVWNFVRRSAYHDSVTLMRASRDVAAVPGVERAAAMMATPANRALLHEAGLLAAEGEAAGPLDLVIAVRARDEAAARAAEAAALALLGGPAGGAAAPRRERRPRSLRSALRAMPDATLALVSVPGPHAAAEARKALAAGLNVMLFSDNVPVDEEVALKREARARGLLLMGPDCGTAILGGVPLGFANAVPRGRIGIAAASGTGLQEVACLVALSGEGVSHAIGVGGRDLSDAVGGLAMEQALDLLADDPATEVVCVVGKPPGQAVSARLAARFATLGKPAVTCFPGCGGSAATLEDCARQAVGLARGEKVAPMEFTLPEAEVACLVDAAAGALAPGQRFVRGVFSGGTLAQEALHLLRAVLPDVAEELGGRGPGHRVVDLGADEFTAGRPHPMIDGALRREWIAREGADPATAVLLVDLVLGYGAHPDPAGEIAPAIEEARARAAAEGRHLAVVASVTGTDADPQDRAAQADRLRAAGAVVMPSNAQAARLAIRIAGAAAGRVGQRRG